jgi:hypothetical protein
MIKGKLARKTSICGLAMPGGKAANRRGTPRGRPGVGHAGAEGRHEACPYAGGKFLPEKPGITTRQCGVISLPAELLRSFLPSDGKTEVEILISRAAE